MIIQEYLEQNLEKLLTIFPPLLCEPAMRILRDPNISIFMDRKAEYVPETEDEQRPPPYIERVIYLELYGFLKEQYKLEENQLTRDQIAAVEHWFLSVTDHCEENKTPLLSLLNTHNASLKLFLLLDNRAVDEQFKAPLFTIDSFMSHLGSSYYANMTLSIFSNLIEVVNHILYKHHRLAINLVQLLCMVAQQIPIHEWQHESASTLVDSIVTTVKKIHVVPGTFNQQEEYQLLQLTQILSTTLPINALTKHSALTISQNYPSWLDCTFSLLLRNAQYPEFVDKELELLRLMKSLIQTFPNAEWFTETQSKFKEPVSPFCKLVLFYGLAIKFRMKNLSIMIMEQVRQLSDICPDSLLRVYKLTTRSKLSLFSLLLSPLNDLTEHDETSLDWIYLIFNMLMQIIPHLNVPLMNVLNDSNTSRKSPIIASPDLEYIPSVLAAGLLSILNVSPLNCFNQFKLFPPVWQNLLLTHPIFDKRNPSLLEHLLYYYGRTNHSSENLSAIFSMIAMIHEASWNYEYLLLPINESNRLINSGTDRLSKYTVLEYTIHFLSGLIHNNQFELIQPIEHMLKQMNQLSHELWWPLLEERKNPLFQLANVLSVTDCPDHSFNEIRRVIARLITDIIIKTPDEKLNRYQKAIICLLPTLEHWGASNQTLTKKIQKAAPKPAPKRATRVAPAIQAPKPLSTPEIAAYINQLKQLTTNAISKQSPKTKSALFDFMAKQTPMQSDVAIAWLNIMVKTLEETQNRYVIELLQRSIDKGMIATHHFHTTQGYLKQLIIILYCMVNQPIASEETLLAMISLVKHVASSPLCWDIPLYTESNGGIWPHVMYLIEVLYSAPPYYQSHLADLIISLIPYWSECMWRQEVKINGVSIDSPLRMFVVMFVTMPENKAFADLISLGIQHAPYEAWLKCGAGDQAEHHPWRVLCNLAEQENHHAKQMQLRLLEKFPNLNQSNTVKTIPIKPSFFQPSPPNPVDFDGSAEEMVLGPQEVMHRP